MARTNIRGNAAPTAVDAPVPPAANQRTPAQAAGEGATPLGAAYAKHAAATAAWSKAATAHATVAATPPHRRGIGPLDSDLIQQLPVSRAATQGQFFTAHPVKNINGVNHVRVDGAWHPMDDNIAHTPDGPVVGTHGVDKKGAPVLHVAKELPKAAEAATVPEIDPHPEWYRHDPDIPQGGFASSPGTYEELESGVESEEDDTPAKKKEKGAVNFKPGAAEALATKKAARGLVRTPGSPANAAEIAAAEHGAGVGAQLKPTYVKGRGRGYTSLEATKASVTHPEGDYYDPEAVGDAVAVRNENIKAHDQENLRSAVPANAEISRRTGEDIPDDPSNRALTHIARQTWGENDKAGLLFLARAHAFAQYRGMKVGDLEQHHVDAIAETVTQDGHKELDSIQAKTAADRADMRRAAARGQEKAALLPSFLPPGAPTTKAAMKKASPEQLAELEKGYQAARKFIAPADAEHTTESVEPEAPTRTPGVGNHPFVGSQDQFHMSDISGTPSEYPTASPGFGGAGGAGAGLVSTRAQQMGEAARSERESEDAAPRLTSKAGARLAAGSVRSLDAERRRNQSYLLQAAEDPRAALAGTTLTDLGEIADEGGFPNKPILEEEGTTVIRYPKGHRLEGEPIKDENGNVQFKKVAAGIKSGKGGKRVRTGVSSRGAAYMRQKTEGFLRENQAADIENRNLEQAMTADVLQQAQTAKSASTIAKGHLMLRQISEAAAAERRGNIDVITPSMKMTPEQREDVLHAGEERRAAEVTKQAQRQEVHSAAIDAHTEALRVHGAGSPEHLAAEEVVNATGRAAHGSAYQPLTDARDAKAKAAAQIKSEKRAAVAKKGFTRIELAGTKAGRRVASSKGVTLKPPEARAQAQAGIAAETDAITQRAMANAARSVATRKRRASKKAAPKAGEQESA